MTVAPLISEMIALTFAANRANCLWWHPSITTSLVVPSSYCWQELNSATSDELEIVRVKPCEYIDSSVITVHHGVQYAMRNTAIIKKRPARLIANTGILLAVFDVVPIDHICMKVYNTRLMRIAHGRLLWKVR